MANVLGKERDFLNQVIDVLRQGPPSERSFTSLLQLLLGATVGRSVLKDKDVIVHSRNLAYLTFNGKDLSGMSLRNCDLTSTSFSSCDLRGTLFEGARLVGTRFKDLGSEALLNARFGDLEHFEFIYDGTRRIDDLQQMKEWIEKRTGTTQEIREPCPAARQLRALFRKFVHPTGAARRDELPKRALTRGKRHPNAPAPEDVIDACLRFEYLQEGPYPGRIKRTPGDLYRDLVSFVRGWDVSEGVGRLLNSLCQTTGCEHIPPGYGRGD